MSFAVGAAVGRRAALFRSSGLLSSHAEHQTARAVASRVAPCLGGGNHAHSVAVGRDCPVVAQAVARPPLLLRVVEEAKRNEGCWFLSPVTRP